MLVTTTENVPGHAVRTVLAQAFGVVVRSRGIGGNITASLRSIVGGEIPEYTRLVEETRRHAIDRMVQNAAPPGARRRSASSMTKAGGWSLCGIMRPPASAAMSKSRRYKSYCN